jgi:hypothetical protein
VENEEKEIIFEIDVGWPWTSDKMMCACAVCGLAMFLPLALDSGDGIKHVPVHDFCLEEAKELCRGQTH